MEQHSKNMHTQNSVAETCRPQPCPSVRNDIRGCAYLVQALEALSVAEPGDNVFVDIARTVSEFLGNRWTGIGCISADGHSIDTIGYWNDGRPGEPFSYPLAGTPCAEVCDHAHPLCIEERVAERYPADTLLGDIGAVSYRGEPLPDQMGKEIGVLWVIDDKPCRDSGSERAFLRVAAKRAALELQRRDNERLLAERNEQLFDTLERISDGFFSLDRDWVFTFVNSTAARMFGADWYVLKDKCLWDALPEVASFFYKPLHNAMKSQQSMNVEGFYPPLHSWLNVHIFPSTIGVSVFLQDISERKKIEQDRRELELRAQRAHKMEAIGQLAAGIAHDFNNILASVMGYADLALARCVSEDQEKLTDYLQQVYRASERGRDLVLQMLSFSRSGVEEALPLDPGPVVEETLKLLQSTLPASIVIHFESSPEAVPAIAISAVHLQQVVMNLCVNARDSMDGKGQITVRLKRHSGASFCCDSCQRAIVSGDFVELAVSDTGEGIASDAMGKLFDPFYTTKEVGKGTGLGLSVVHGIVHDHGGHIRVESIAGKGSIFRMLLPAVAVGVETGRIDVADTLLLPHVRPSVGGRILIVDDEPALLGLIDEILTAEGFEVKAHSDSSKALTDFQQDPRGYDLVITDLTMPGLTGTELALEIRALRPDMPILLCTGYSGGLSLESMPEQAPCGFLAKPYDRLALLSRIGGLLNIQRKGGNAQ